VEERLTTDSIKEQWELKRAAFLAGRRPSLLFIFGQGIEKTKTQRKSISGLLRNQSFEIAGSVKALGVCLVACAGSEAIVIIDSSWLIQA
jgi:hypothetical protein